MGKIRGDLQATQLEPLVNTYKAAEQALGNAINGMAGGFGNMMAGFMTPQGGGGNYGLGAETPGFTTYGSTPTYGMGPTPL